MLTYMFADLAISVISYRTSFKLQEHPGAMKMDRCQLVPSETMTGKRQPFRNNTQIALFVSIECNTTHSYVMLSNTRQWQFYAPYICSINRVYV